jgi:2'-5' RNA ligase
MRLFTGISIETGTLRKLESLLAELRPLARVKWSPPENLHITAKFIGEWPEARLAELEQALARVAPAGPVPIQVAGLGYYRSALYAGVVPSAGLLHLARSIDEGLETIGCPREVREYSPHLTLARFRNENIRQLRERTENMSNTEFGSFEARSFHLYLSKTGPGGSVYSILRTYELC